MLSLFPLFFFYISATNAATDNTCRVHMMVLVVDIAPSDHIQDSPIATLHSCLSDRM